MKINSVKLLNIIFFTAITILLAFNKITYAKTIDLSGISISLTTEKESKEAGNGVNVKAEKEYNDTEYEKEEKETKDKGVTVRLTITNNNPYEDAKITIKENAPSGFRQEGSNKNTNTININLSKSENKTWTYNYKYDKKYLKDQYNSLVYDENGELLEDDNIKVLDDKNNLYVDSNGENIKYKEYGNANKEIENIEKKINKKGNTFLFILAVILVIMFVFFAFLLIFTKLRNLRNKYDDDSFNIIVIVLLSSFLISLIYKPIYASAYTPNIYSNIGEFKKVIYESTTFNERKYRFEYEITVKFSNSNTIAYSDLDTDNDGLFDYDEYMYMTDINKKDTDNDGLSDYIEVKVLHYNPLSYDTFNDSRNDANRDYDGDGLSNIKEIELGTSLILEDTDGDTISDYDEVYTYFTDPLMLDTDGDGLFDNIELKLGLDPTTMYSDGTTLDSERKIEQELDVTSIPEELTKGDISIIGIKGDVKGFIDDSITFHNYHNNNFDNVTSLVSDTFNIENENDDEITITFDGSKMSDRIEKLILCKYENGMFVPIDTDFKDNKLEAKVTSGIYGMVDSEYILRDMNIYVKDYLH